MRMQIRPTKWSVPIVMAFWWAAACPAARAQTVTVTGSGADNAVRYDFSTAAASLGTVNSQSNGVGDVKGISQPASAEFVYVFALPALGSGTLSSANLALYITGKPTTPTFTVDLSGVRFSGSSTVLASDNYQGAAFGSGTGTIGTPLQGSILTPTTSLGTVTTSVSGTSSLAAFLSQAYNANGTVKTGDTYVFLNLHRSTKVTQDAAPVDVYNLSTADNTLAASAGKGTNGGTSEKPMLTLTASPASAPEPGGLISLLVGAAAISTRIAARRRQRAH